MVLHAARGQFHERLLERGADRGQLVQPDALLKRDVANRLRGHPADLDGAVAVGGRGRALGGHALDQVVRHRGAHPHGRAGGARDELRHRAVGDQLAPADHDQVVGGGLHLRHQVAGDEDRAPLGGQGLHQVPDPQDALGVEPVDRLVEHEHPGIAEQGRGDAQALAHAQREPLGPLLRHLGQADKLEDLADAALRQVVGLRQAEQVVIGRPAAVHRLRVEQRANLAHRVPQVAVVAAVHRDGASVRVVKPEDAPHRSGLAGPVRTQEAGDPARLNAERQPIDGGFLAVPLREALHLNH